MIDNESLHSLERLHKLKEDGVITAEDFETAKQNLLQGKGRRKTTEAVAAPPAQNGELSLEDHVQWALLPLRRYAQFDGRSGRREFWTFYLMVTAVIALLFAIGSTGSINAAFALLTGIIGLIGIAIPAIAVQVRRFHDQGKSGWFALLNLIPFGWILILIFMALPGTEGENQYGPDPLAE